MSGWVLKLFLRRGPPGEDKVWGMDRWWRRCSVSEALSLRGCVDLELQGSSTEDSSLEVISMLAGGSSAHAICWPATRANSLRSLVLPTSPARRLESSLHSRPRGHKLALRSIPGVEPNLASRAQRATARASPSHPCRASFLHDWAGWFLSFITFFFNVGVKKNELINFGLATQLVGS